MNGKENRSPPFFDSLSLSTLGANYPCFANELSGAVAFFPISSFFVAPANCFFSLQFGKANRRGK